LIILSDALIPIYLCCRLTSWLQLRCCASYRWVANPIFYNRR